MKPFLSMDAHAHIRPTRTALELSAAGVVLAVTLSLDEARKTLGREEPYIVWGVGCHPRKIKAQESFNPDRFVELVEQLPLIGEVGLDSGSSEPMELQRQNFRTALEAAARYSRPVSIHSFRTTALVLEELRRTPVPAPILHWWTGSVAETREAVALGCYFSIHSAVARHSKFRSAVPASRLLVESDHGWNDPPAAIPCRVHWVEHLIAVQYGMDVNDVRRQVWSNFGRIVADTNIQDLLPEALNDVLADVSVGMGP